ncbi:DNA polymerase I [Chitinimonas sp. BJB300]|uniref:DNA polymerase I n=1 Tax=Chitinimonas sp. BJB300 TaxID=1559339 RepID=UPI000C0FF949|nr:DNA polymerase I [Chitinimonas sp. BJB300]PHV12745.1 DNA polymerase I [Chitinimonas sp. BJB300]TSJ90924.1 DNA polymerase I [Chitinimonas sp. BJB300]
MSTKTLLLIDGSSYLYRAFHALPDLRSPSGAPTGALRGILAMLKKLVKEVPADYIGCVFDAKGKTFRDALYPEYKAQRPSMPDDLRAQIEPIHAAIAAMGLPILMVDGVEADDVIGTLACQANALGMAVVVSTGDKDMAQLVTSNVRLVNTMSEETLDEAGVLAKFGVSPNRIVDYLALIGDTVDNVPGVPKCGPKTAVKWLSEHGSLDGVMANAHQIGGVVGQNLRDTLTWLPMGRTLVTIKCDVDLSAEMPQGFDNLAPRDANKAMLTNLFETYGFKSWLAELKGDAAIGDKIAAEGNASAFRSFAPDEMGELSELPRNYEAIQTEAQLDAWIARLDAADLVAVDTETDSLEPLVANIVGISVALAEGDAGIRAAYLPLGHRYADAPVQLAFDATLAKLKPWLENPSKKKLGQNLKYDQHVFANHGIALAGVSEDTLLQSYVLDSTERHGMDELAAKHLGLKAISYEEVAGKGAKQIGFAEVAIDVATRYSAEDADITLRLHQLFAPRLAADAKLDYVYRQIELPSREVLFKMERQGVLLDSSLLQKQSHELGQSMLRLEQEAYELAGQPFNLGSPKQIGEILFDKLKLPVIKKTPKGAPSTDEDVLSELARDFPLPAKLLQHRSLAKLKSTYTDKLPLMVNTKTGRVHTNYGQATAVTGRLASNDPNLQNIPVRTTEGRRIREAFIAPPGHQIVSADYSQIELRIMAHLSSDEGMLKAFEAGIDIHRATAAEVFGATPETVTADQRRYAKAINFGLIYGMSAFGLAAQLDIERSAAQNYIDRYFARYPGVAAYMQTTRETAREQGYVETWFGRRLWLPEIRASNQGRRQGAERAAINAPMQGTAADLIKLAMIAVQDWVERDNLKTRLIMQVHDELVLEVPDEELALVKVKLPALMSGVADLKVPLLAEVGIGLNWEAAH